MKNNHTVLRAAALAGVLAGAGFVYLIAPGRCRREQRSPFLRRYFAHRGLYDAAAGVPENSLAAFRAAAEKGYGVELDTRLTADGQVVISHDSRLERMTGTDAVVEESTYDELCSLRLGGTEERVPLFTEAMDILCEANVPVIVEVKPANNRAHREALCAGVLSVLDRHDGEFCVESFDPKIVRWFRKNAPELLRGQLTAQRDNLGSTPLLNWLASRVMFNFMGRPQFIAHRVGKKSLSVRIAERLGAMRVCWTAHDRTEEAGSDAVIFESFRPPKRYL